jgi:hypothetical protein
VFSRQTGGESVLPPIVGSTLLALCIIALPALARNQILNGRVEVGLTPVQQAVVNKITRSPGTVNVGVLKRTQTTDGGPPENRYARLVLPLSNGKDITLIRTRPSVKSERGFTWRGVAEETSERAIIMLWNDGHLSGYFAYKGRVFSVNHIGGDIHTMSDAPSYQERGRSLSR